MEAYGFVVLNFLTKHALMYASYSSLPSLAQDYLFSLRALAITLISSVTCWACHCNELYFFITVLDIGLNETDKSRELENDQITFHLALRCPFRIGLS